MCIITMGLVAAPSGVASAATQAPTLGSPTTGATFSLRPGEPTPSVFTVNASLPQAVLANSVRITLVMSTDSNVSRVIVVNSTSQSINRTFDPLAPAASLVSLPWVAAVTTTINGVGNSTSRMPDGSYTVGVSYQNSIGDSASSASATSVTLRSLCVPGSFSDSGFVPCTSAGPGHFVNTYGAASALPCAPGTFQSNSGAAECTQAPAGTYVDLTGASAATAAPPGRFVPTGGATSPETCPAGTYQPNFGATTCLHTSVGHYTDSAGSARQIPAPPGSFVAVSNSTQALQCAAGTYQPTQGQSTCIDASINHFVSAAGSSVQMACPAGTQASNTRSITCTLVPSSASSPQGANATPNQQSASSMTATLSVRRARGKTTFTINTSAAGSVNVFRVTGSTLRRIRTVTSVGGVNRFTINSTPRAVYVVRTTAGTPLAVATG